MINREKVIEGLECCADDASCRDCPYYDRHRYGDINNCTAELAADALALIKEQEAEIRQLRLALDITKGTCKGIVMERRAANDQL